MSLFIKLDAYLDFNIFQKIKDTIRSDKHTKVAIAPANGIAEKIIVYLKNNGYPYKSISVYDKDITKQFPLRIRDYKEVIQDRPDKIFIVSTQHVEAIKKRFLSLGVDASSIISGGSHLPESMTVDSAIKYIFSAERKEDVGALFDFLGEKDIAVINCPTFFYDVSEKVKVIKRELGMEILWIDCESNPIADTGIIRANIVDVINYIRHRTRKDNILYFSVNPVWHLVMLYLMRTAFTEIKIILYKYDWLTLTLPNTDALRRLVNLPVECVESEYYVFDLILKGEIVDGIMYKDGGDNLSLLKNYPRPKLFFPPYLSNQLYQEPVKDTGIPNKFVFLAALTPIVNDNEVFDRSTIEAFSELIAQEFEIDVYEPRSQAMVNQYREYFKKFKSINFIMGKPLDVLLPEIAGKYHWGLVPPLSEIDVPEYIKKHREELYKVAHPARVYSYLALGVPVVVSDKAKAIADLVDKNKIGVVISANDIKKLRSVLLETDYAQLQRNVLDFREEISLEKQKGRFVDFISAVMKNDTKHM